MEKKIFQDNIERADPPERKPLILDNNCDVWKMEMFSVSCGLYFYGKEIVKAIVSLNLSEMLMIIISIDSPKLRAISTK